MPSWLHLVNKIGGRNLHAREILRRVDSILDSDDLKPTEKGLLIESLESDLGDFERLIRQLETTLRSVHEAIRTVAEGRAEIGVLYPKEHFGDLEEFGREVTELNRHLRPLMEVSGESGSPQLESLETNSFEIFVSASTAVGALIATIIWRLLRTWQQIEEIRKLRAETRKIDAEASELLDKRAQRLREEAIQRIHKDVMEKCAPSIDAARRNELEISVKQSIAYIDTKIQTNVLFEVSVVTPPEGSRPANQAEMVDIKLIHERGAALWQIQAKLARLLLPVVERPKNNGEDGA